MGEFTFFCFTQLQIVIHMTEKKKDIGREILELHAEGLSYSEIALKLGCSKSAVGYHCGSGFRRLPKICKVCSKEMPGRRLYDECHECKVKSLRDKPLVCKKCHLRKDRINFPKQKQLSRLPDGSVRYDTKQRRFCYECLRIKGKEYLASQDQEELLERKRIQRMKHKFKKYGLPLEKAILKLEEQNHKCGICGTAISLSIPQEVGFQRACLDHCHSSMQIRDFLCGKCNTFIGLADEDISILQSAIDYINRFG